MAQLANRRDFRLMEPLTIHTECRLRDSAGAIVPYASAWWRGAPVNWRIAIFNADGSLSDLAGLNSIVLSITNAVNGRPGGVPWFSRVWPAHAFNPDLSADEWKARSAWHFEAALSGDDTLMAVSGISASYWALLEGLTGAGERIPLAALQVELRSTLGTGLDRDHLGYAGTLTFDGVPFVLYPE